jgi:AbiV family abortive infection protein
MSPSDFKPGIVASLENGNRLLDDAKTVLDLEHFPTSYALAVLAQEEYAKALLLSLVDAGAVPWSADVRRSLHDHVCKQLLSIILDYLAPDDDEFFRRHDLSRIGERPAIFPSDVLDAIHVICHERIPRERERWWLDPSERPLDHRVKVVADGRLDAQKQRAIYVQIGKSGEVVSQPSQLSPDNAKAEVERAERIGQQLRPYGRAPGLPDGLDSEKLIALFRLLTGSISPEEFSRYWWAR